MKQVVVVLGKRYGGPVLGIDLRGGAVRAAVVRRVGKNWEITRWAEVGAPEQESGALQPDLGVQLKAALAKLGEHPRRAVLVIGFQHVLLRRFRFPRMKPARMRQLVERDGDRYIPFCQEGANFDLKMLRQLEGRQTDLLLTAVKSRLVAPVQQACKAAKLTLVAMDIDMVALFRAARVAEKENPPLGITALLDVGRDMVRMALYLDGFMLGGRGFQRTAESTSELAIEVRRSLEVLLSQHARDEAENIRLASLYTTGALADAPLSAELTRLFQADMAHRLAPDFAIHPASLPGGDAPPELLSAFGAALATTGPPVPADLLPRLTWAERQQRANKVALTIGLLGAVAAYGGYWNRSVQATTARMVKAEQTILANQQALKRKSEIERLEARQKELQPVLNDLRVMQKPVHELLPALAALTPAGLRLTDTNLQAPQLALHGTTEKASLLVDLIQRLSAEPYVASVGLRSITATGSEKFQFDLIVTLKGAEGGHGNGGI